MIGEVQQAKGPLAIARSVVQTVSSAEIKPPRPEARVHAEQGAAQKRIDSKEISHMRTQVTMKANSSATKSNSTAIDGDDDDDDIREPSNVVVVS